MKYALDRMLPLRAFQGRGTPIGGRGLRLYGDGGYTSNDYDPNWLANTFPEYAAANPEPAPADAAPIYDSPGFVDPSYSGAPPEPAPANQWQQTVNDIYQQEFGRQADASGMESFTALLNQGLTGEQMRDTLRTSAEGQSMGLSPAPAAPAAPVAPLTAAKTAQWEWQPGSQDEFTGAVTQPYWRDINSGTIKAADPVQYTGVNVVDPNTLAQHLAPNYEGTPTQFYDAQGNLKGVLIDTVRMGMGAKEGSLILDPASLGLALDPGEKPSINSVFQATNAEGQLLFVDPNTGEPTIYNTGVPVKSVTTLKDKMYINDPGKRGGQIPADMQQGALLLAATMLTGGVGGALLEAAGIGAGAAGGLTAGEASALMGIEAGAPSLTAGLTPEMIAASEAALPGASGGINWGAAATAAARTAAINAAVTAAQGGNIGDVLKAGALGAVTGGAGVAGADLLGGGALAQIGTQTAIATAAAAATGKDPVQAALNGALVATFANVMPTATKDIFTNIGVTDPSVQKALNSSISASILTALKGGNVGTAALTAAAVSGVNTVAGMIGNSQIVQDIKANISDFVSSTIDSVKYEIGATNAQALPIESSNRSPVGTVLDTAPYNADAALDRVIQNLPSSASGVEYTPAALSNVVTPPLIQQATGQADADAIYNQLIANAANSTVGAPLANLAGAVTSDVNPPSVSGDGVTVNISGTNGRYQSLLDSYNTGIATLGYPPVSMDDQDFLDFANKEIEADSGIGINQNDATSASLNNIARLTPEQAMSAGIPAGIYKIIVGGTDPQNTVIGSNATSVPIPSNAADIYNQILNLYGDTDATAFVVDNPELTKNALIDLGQKGGLSYEQIQSIADAFVNNPSNVAAFKMQVANVINLDPSNPVFDTQATSPLTSVTTPTQQPPLTPAEPVKTPTASASSSSSGDTKPAGGLGTQGAAAAGNEGAPGAVSPSGAAALTEAQNIVSQAASANDIAAVDIPIDTQRLVSNSAALGTSPAQAVASGLVNPDGSLTAKGVQQISDATGLSPSDVVALTNASTTARTDTGSGITSTGAGATTGAATGAALAGTGIGGSTGTNIGGLGTGTGTGVGPGAGTGTGDGSGDGLGLGLGSGSGTGTSGAGTGGVKAAAAPVIAQPSYSYSGAGSQGTTVGALPGSLQGTFLQGVNVNEYNPFENYDVYQQLAPIHAAQGGSPLQLAQMQQGIYGVDPSLYGVIQKRAAPNYFTYGTDASGGNPTTFAGSQLMGKPTPNIPVIPTGKVSGADWLYQGSGTNPLAMAGTGIPSLGAGTMAEGGSAHGEGEHIPEFITGATGHYVRGRGDGQSDEIPAMLADGEYVFDASTVSTLGNGSSDAGAKLLDAFRESLRDHTRSAPADKIPPKASPLEYMKDALQHVGRK